MLVVLGSANAGAQEWNEARTLTLVRLATERRAQQLADSGLVDYQAIAHGYVTFLAQLGEGFREPPKVVKADELALQVYWRTPNLSKQRIVGRRDTTLLPTDIQYHRDHLGIIQNNFPAIIRLGDGDEVQDVPHPLSPLGITEYDFALTDSLRITIPGRVIGVYEVKIRPRDDREPRVIGAIYLDRDNAQVVRMALSFTRAAFLDKQLEDLFVVLENGLVGTRFWLPRRQEIEIRRTATWLDYPARGIIRGRWEIGDYELNQGIPLATFAGSEIVNAPEAVRRMHTWPSANILDSLPPDIRSTTTAEEVRRVQAEVRALVREQALRRARGSVLAARGVSDFVRFNRVEGVAFGAGLSWQLGRGFGVSARARHGLADERTKTRFELTWQNAAGVEARAHYANSLTDAGDLAERSLLVNSLAAQETGSDYTDPYGLESIGGGGSLTFGSSRLSLDVARERHRAVNVNAQAASGTFEATIPAAPLALWRGALRLDRPTSLGRFGLEFRGNGELRVSAADGRALPVCAGPCTATTVTRGSFTLEVERPTRDMRFVSRTFGAAAVATGNLIAQELVFLGGPVSAPGYSYHSLVSDRAASQHIEWHIPVPFPAIAIGRFGKAPARAMLVPHGTLVWLHQPDIEVGILRSGGSVPSPDPLRPRETGLYPSIGTSMIVAFDLLRFDVSRGLRDGRWVFSLDLVRPFWSIM